MELLHAMRSISLLAGPSRLRLEGNKGDLYECGANGPFFEGEFPTPIRFSFIKLIIIILTYQSLRVIL